jgi:RNA polymerase sigma-70 factor (ECF subfamily)
MEETAPLAAPDRALADADESLMRAFAAGDAAAFTRLYDRHAKRVFRFIARSLGAHHASAADDVLQETWITVARQAPRYVPTARFSTWLFTVARSRVIDHLRRQGRGHELSLDAEMGDADGDASPTLADCMAADERHEPLHRLEHREQALAFFNALEALPLVQREAFLLQAEAGLSVDEIALATGVGAETAKSRLRYARAKLREALAAWN